MEEKKVERTQMEKDFFEACIELRMAAEKYGYWKAKLELLTEALSNRCSLESKK